MSWLMDEGFSALTKEDEGANALYSGAPEFRQRHVLRELRALRGLK